MQNFTTGVLALEDGTLFKGRAFGAQKTVLGEAVFNTSMTGYQEILTDPSYYGQIVTLTAPQIGNYGVNERDYESSSPKAQGLIVKELSPITSNWRCEKTLDEYLKKYNLPGLEGVDTRAITKKVRQGGIMKACLSTENISDEEAIKRARKWKGLEGVDCATPVSCDETYIFQTKKTEHQPFTVSGTNLHSHKGTPAKYHVVAFDFGAKRNIFLKLRYYGFKVTVVPSKTSADEVRALNPDGIFLSNGPGDPAALDYAYETVRELLPDYPMFGICLGHQLITLALGAKTFKLKFGHRGANQPVKNLETGKVDITAQNHGYAASPEELEKNGAIVTHINLNDGTVSGIKHKELPVFSVQYHPEASPGPNDATTLFDDFYKLIEKTKVDNQEFDSLSIPQTV